MNEQSKLNGNDEANPVVQGLGIVGLLALLGAGGYGAAQYLKKGKAASTSTAIDSALKSANDQPAEVKAQAMSNAARDAVVQAESPFRIINKDIVDLTPDEIYTRSRMLHGAIPMDESMGLMQGEAAAQNFIQNPANSKVEELKLLANNAIPSVQGTIDYATLQEPLMPRQISETLAKRRRTYLSDADLERRVLPDGADYGGELMVGHVPDLAARRRSFIYKPNKGSEIPKAIGLLPMPSWQINLGPYATSYETEAQMRRSFMKPTTAEEKSVMGNSLFRLQRDINEGRVDTRGSNELQSYIDVVKKFFP